MFLIQCLYKFCKASNPIFLYNPFKIAFLYFKAMDLLRCIFTDTAINCHSLLFYFCLINLYNLRLNYIHFCLHRKIPHANYSMRDLVRI